MKGNQKGARKDDRRHCVTPSQMTYDLRRLRLKGLVFRPPKTNRSFLTPHYWKVARSFNRLDARVFRPAMAMFTNRGGAQLDELIYDAFLEIKAS